MPRDPRIRNTEGPTKIKLQLIPDWQQQSAQFRYPIDVSLTSKRCWVAGSSSAPDGAVALEAVCCRSRDGAAPAEDGGAGTGSTLVPIAGECGTPPCFPDVEASGEETSVAGGTPAGPKSRKVSSNKIEQTGCGGFEGLRTGAFFFSQRNRVNSSRVGSRNIHHKKRRGGEGHM